MGAKRQVPSARFDIESAKRSADGKGHRAAEKRFVKTVVKIHTFYGPVAVRRLRIHKRDPVARE
jgi:hypothetical protein